ncbi:DUF4838 domain-containing protein [Kriegella sp. EG-1]|nr:DUF4838 domain-containing protein [Flavobacteriaceae bacterium EG-1]
MKNILYLSIVLFFCSFTTFEKNIVSNNFILTVNGKSNCTIIIPENATTTEVLAAKVFQDYIKRISGAFIQIKSDTNPKSNKEVLIGSVNRIPKTQIKDLGSDGFHILSNKNNLIISGGNKKGVIYGVYTFLERYLGCRKYSSKVSYIPKLKSISLNFIDDLELPAFDYREVYYSDVLDPEYANWHKLDSHGNQPTNKSEWGSFVHTFHTLLNPEEYGESHPEYFSYYNGKRHAGTMPSWDGTSLQPESQLCLSNPDVLEVVCANLKIEMDKNPNAIYWSVSQNDNVNYCKCDSCAALDKKYAAFTPEQKMYGTHVGHNYPALSMGSMLTFVNKVAERFPDKIISTLAYQHTRVPPKEILPASNVNIMLCNIESTRNVPIEIGDKAFTSDLEAWGKLTDNIIVWDYVIQFKNLLAPFPNLKTLKPNIKLFKKNNVSALFEQGNREIGGEFAELRAYLLAKLMWNPDLNIDTIIDEFLTGYYKEAGPYIKQYIELLHQNNQANTDKKLSIFGSPVDETNTFLTPSLINQYNAIFDKAEKAVHKNEEILNRVKLARLPVYYAMLEISNAKLVDQTNFKSNSKTINILHEFVYQCVKNNVSRISEWHTTPEEYLEKCINLINESSN